MFLEQYVLDGTGPYKCRKCLGVMFRFIDYSPHRRHAQRSYVCMDCNRRYLGKIDGLAENYCKPEDFIVEQIEDPMFCAVFGRV